MCEYNRVIATMKVGEMEKQCIQLWSGEAFHLDKQQF